MKKVWFDEAWEDFVYWQSQDKKTLKRIISLLKDIERGHFDGIGKPTMASATLFFTLNHPKMYGFCDK